MIMRDVTLLDFKDERGMHVPARFRLRAEMSTSVPLRPLSVTEAGDRHLPLVQGYQLLDGCPGRGAALSRGAAGPSGAAAKIRQPLSPKGRRVGRVCLCPCLSDDYHHR